MTNGLTMPDTISRPITAAIRNHILWKLGGNAAIIASIFWLLTGVAFTLELFGLQLARRRFGRETVLEAKWLLLIALVITLLSLLFVAPRVWRALYLARVGQVAKGTVRRRLGVTMRGFDTILISYSVEQQAFTTKIGVNPQEFSSGLSVPMIYDPAKPRLAMPQDYLFPRNVRVES